MIFYSTNGTAAAVVNARDLAAQLKVIGQKIVEHVPDRSARVELSAALDKVRRELTAAHRKRVAEWDAMLKQRGPRARSRSPKGRRGTGRQHA
ncbi:MAG: hypothetical protein JNL08_05845 [Planctomycetes bacterium]|nr:hypothetical protein [Planctomycetota bacterium]